MPRTPTHLVFASVAVIDGDRVLLVQEGKADVRGRWNLPGGGVERGESPVEAARREVREETGLSIDVSGVLRIWASSGWLRFVFAAGHPRSVLVAGDDILAARWWRMEDAQRLDDESLHPPAKLMRETFESVRSGRTYTSDVIRWLPE